MEKARTKLEPSVTVRQLICIRYGRRRVCVCVCVCVCLCVCVCRDSYIHFGKCHLCTNTQSHIHRRTHKHTRTHMTLHGTQGANADGTHRQRTSTNSWDHQCVHVVHVDIQHADIHAPKLLHTTPLAHIHPLTSNPSNWTRHSCREISLCSQTPTHPFVHAPFFFTHSSESAKALIARAFDLARVPYNINLRDAIQASETNCATSLQPHIFFKTQNRSLWWHIDSA